jgi:hypothetical protein
MAAMISRPAVMATQRLAAQRDRVRNGFVERLLAEIEQGRRIVPQHEHGHERNDTELG